MTVRVGTRGSALALAQTRLVSAALEDLGVRCQVITVRTAGDCQPDRPTGALGAGAFVKELEAALLDGRIDLAVHSAKDLPSDLTDGLVLAAFPPREDPRDALVTRDATGLQALPTGAVIGTESPRRRAFVLAARPDLVVRGIRGNVDTRLRKLESGDVDGLVLAAAGLARLGLSHRVAEPFDTTAMLPAVGQGALAVQTRAGAGDLRRTLAALDDPATRAAVEAERAFLAAMGGGCQRPIAALARAEGARLSLEGAVLDPNGRGLVRASAEGSPKEPGALGAALADRLVAMGARTLLMGAAR